MNNEIKNNNLVDEKLKITISGIGGVGKGTTAKILGKKLNLKTLSGGDFFRKKAEELDKTLYEFDEFVKDNPEYDREIDFMQKSFGEEYSGFILESRLGWFFVPDSVKIKLICEEGERLKRVNEREGGDFEEIKKNEERRLKSINERYRKLYDIDNFQDKNNFNLIVDTTKNNPEEVVGIILKFIKK